MGASVQRLAQRRASAKGMALPERQPCRANPSGFRAIGDARWPFAFCAARNSPLIARTNQSASSKYRPGGCRGLSFRREAAFKGSAGSLVHSRRLVHSRNSLIYSRSSLVHSRNTTHSRSGNRGSNSVAIGTGTDCTRNARFGLARGRSLQRRDCSWASRMPVPT